MQKYPVTMQEYLNFVNVSQDEYNILLFDLPDYVVEESSGILTIPDDDATSYPATNVTWYGAFEYTKWVNSESNLWEYRLPTAEELTYACTNAGRNRYPWGDDIDDLNGNHRLLDGEYLIYLPVGSNPENANQWGMYDLIGSVSQWSSTPYQSGDSSVRKRPQMIQKGGTSVPNPGFWFSSSTKFPTGFDCRPFGKNAYKEAFAFPVGFRLVATPMVKSGGKLGNR